ncbi:MAG TPA: sensor histidine kinase [Cytophagaceae bacterium]
MRHIFFLLLIFISNTCPTSGRTIHVIDDKTRDDTKVGSEQILLDFNEALTIQEVSNPTRDSLFKAVDNPDRNSEYFTYWVKFTLKWQTKNTFILSTPLPCKRIDLYTPNNKGGFDRVTSGVQIPFWNKNLKTNRHSFPLFHTELGHLSTYYVKVVAYNFIVPLLITRNDHFINARIGDYFFQGIMLGIVFVAAFYNMILFWKLRESAYLFYSLYVVFFGLFGLLIWHYQFNFLWWIDINHTLINLTYNVVYCLTTIFFLLYAKNFFFYRNKGSLLDRAFKYLIYLRVTCFFLGIFVIPSLREAWIDTVILFPVFIIGYYSHKKRFLPSKNFIFAFSALFIGMFVHSSSEVLREIIGPDFKTNHIFFICGSTGMFLFSLSLGERMQLLLEEKDRTKTQLIIQLEHNEILKNDQNQELERKVKERTVEIEERNKQLDTFVYRASHDIKGPLRSIIGLSRLGEMEAPDEKIKNYFTHILSSSGKLDATLTDLLNVVKMNHAEIKKQDIDFKHIVNEILYSFQYHPNFRKIKFNIDIQEDITFQSDYRLLFSLLQNLIENSINYRDQEKAYPFVKILVRQNNGSVIILLEDNGIGISDEHKEKIFEMFFKIDARSSGTGLGMYLVKQTLERLGGAITMESQRNVGTKFKVTFGNEPTS